MIIILENIQAIERAIFELKDTGLVQITGGNSNGKSILEKALKGISSLNITDVEERRSLIRRNQPNPGRVAIQYKGKTLVVNLTLEKRTSFIYLKRVDGSEVKRTLGEGGLREILHEFGFRVFAKDQLCLQLHETFGLMPFINTSPLDNGEMVETATTDSTAEAFKQNYKEITYKVGKECLKSFDNKIANLQATLSGMTLYDYRAYDEAVTELQKFYRNLTFLSFLEIPKLNIPPNVNFCDLPEMKLQKLEFVTVYDGVGHLDNIYDLVNDLSLVRQGVCPKCGKRLLGGGDLCQE